MSTGLILLAPSFLGVLNFEPVPDMMRRLTLCNSSFQKRNPSSNFQKFSVPPQPCGFLQEMICFAVEITADVWVFQREPKPKTELWYCLAFADSLHCLPIYPEVLFQSCLVSEAMVLTGTKNLPFAREEKSSSYMRLLSRNGCWEKRALG